MFKLIERLNTETEKALRPRVCPGAATFSPEPHLTSPALPIR